MISREEYHLAIDRVHQDLIDVLSSWMNNEKGNLESYIANPQGHILYNEFVKPDLVALASRSVLLGQVVFALNVISAHKRGVATRSQHDYALDQIPHILFTRLLDWMKNRYVDYSKIMENANIGIPISEYGDLAVFDKESFSLQMDTYREAIEGLEIIIQYKIEQATPVEQPTAPDGDIEDPPEE